jgi:hypothetical protein
VPLVNAQTRAFLAADPARTGHFALTVLDSTATHNQVYTTTDSGETWRGPAVVGEERPNPRFKPWLSFGPSGQLALTWRSRHPDQANAYDIWAPVGRDEGSNGPVFSAPVRVSSAAAPYPPTNPTGGGDDFSFIVADQKYVHVGWGDSRSGKVQVWYGRIALPVFVGPP